jgi:hypothetical protein
MPVLGNGIARYGFYLFIAALIIPLSSLAAQPPSENPFPKYKDTRCFKVANSPSTWPEGSKGKTVMVEDGPVLVTNIPADFNKVIRSGTSTLFFYENAVMISFNPISLQHFPETTQLARGSTLTTADVWKIMLTKTPADTEPTNMLDAALWRWAIGVLKTTYLASSGPVWSTRHGSILAFYYSDITEFSKKTCNVAFIVNEKYPDTVLQISSIGIPPDEFKALVGSVRGKNAER